MFRSLFRLGAPLVFTAAQQYWQPFILLIARPVSSPCFLEPFLTTRRRPLRPGKCKTSSNSSQSVLSVVNVNYSRTQITRHSKKFNMTAANETALLLFEDGSTRLLNKTSTVSQPHKQTFCSQVRRATPKIRGGETPPPLHPRIKNRV